MNQERIEKRISSIGYLWWKLCIRQAKWSKLPDFIFTL